MVTFPANEKATLESYKNIDETEEENEEIAEPEVKKDCIDNIDSVRTFEKAIATKFSNQDAKTIVAKAKEIFQRDVDLTKTDQRDAELICQLSLQAALLQIKNIQ